MKSNFVANQLQQIANGGLPVFVKKIKTFLFVCVSVLFLPVILVVRLIRPWVLVRFSPLGSHRIGQFALNTEVYLCNLDFENKKGVVDCFFLMKPVCNAQLKKMWERVLIVSPIVEFLYKANRLLPRFERHETPILESAFDHRDLMSTMKPHLKFTDDEERKGREGLRSLGIPEGAEFICFSNRDQAYLNTVQPGIDWSYHDVRNSHIGSYLPAVEAMTRKGYYAVRMGSIVGEPLMTGNGRIIDYASSGRSEFLDIYLCAKAKMYLGDTSGIHTVAKIFRVPIVYTNLARFSLVELDFLCHDALFIPKKVWDKNASRYLTAKEMLKLDDVPIFTFGQYCRDHGLEIVDNSAGEIEDISQEWADRQRGIFSANAEDERLQKAFWAACGMEHIHEKKNARIGTEFLRENAYLTQRDENELSDHISSGSSCRT